MMGVEEWAGVGGGLIDYWSGWSVCEVRVLIVSGEGWVWVVVEWVEGGVGCGFPVGFELCFMFPMRFER